MFRKKLMRLGTALLLLMMLPLGAFAYDPLPMDSYAGGPALKDENFLSDYEYKDETISVEIGEGRYADTDYVYAHVKISDPSQLRTAPAALVNSPNATFRSTSTARGRYIARAVNAVIAINGDYFTKKDKCQVVMRQGVQLRNVANGEMDLLIIDKNGNLSALEKCDKKTYAEYYENHQDEMYQVFCFGPVLVRDGKSVIAPDYRNNQIGSLKSAQRAAIAQIGPLEYILVTTEGPQTKGSKGMTIPEFATVCQDAGLMYSENGCQLAFNLDGGNSATMCFKRMSPKGKLLYAKINSPEIERFLSDMIYFTTLVDE